MRYDASEGHCRICERIVATLAKGGGFTLLTAGKLFTAAATKKISRMVRTST